MKNQTSKTEKIILILLFIICVCNLFSQQHYKTYTVSKINYDISISQKLHNYQTNFNIDLNEIIFDDSFYNYHIFQMQTVSPLDYEVFVNAPTNDLEGGLYFNQNSINSFYKCLKQVVKICDEFNIIAEKNKVQNVKIKLNEKIKVGTYFFAVSDWVYVDNCKLTFEYVVISGKSYCVLTTRKVKRHYLNGNFYSHEGFVLMFTLEELKMFTKVIKPKLINKHLYKQVPMYSCYLQFLKNN